jgi:hypothetical protein
MPNRKTFDEREKYDHSGRPLDSRLPGDLQPDIADAADSHSDRVSDERGGRSDADRRGTRPEHRPTRSN